MAFILKHDIGLRMLYCGFLRRDTGRAIAVNKIQQEYFEGNVFIDMRKGGPENKRCYRYFADSNDHFSSMSPWGDELSLLWQAFMKAAASSLGDTRLFMKT